MKIKASNDKISNPKDIRTKCSEGDELVEDIENRIKIILSQYNREIDPPIFAKVVLQILELGDDNANKDELIKNVLKDEFLKQLPGFIKGRIRQRLNDEDIYIFSTLEEKNKYINELSESILERIRNIIALGGFNEGGIHQLTLRFPTKLELDKHIDKCLIHIDKDKFPFPNYEDEVKQKEKNEPDKNIQSNKDAYLREFVKKELSNYPNVKKNESVPRTIINKIFEKAIKAGLTKAKDPGTIRKTCSDLGYSKERRNYH
jgi:hypothetical protein